MNAHHLQIHLLYVIGLYVNVMWRYTYNMTIHSCKGTVSKLPCMLFLLQLMQLQFIFISDLLILLGVQGKTCKQFNVKHLKNKKKNQVLQWEEEEKKNKEG